MAKQAKTNINEINKTKYLLLPKTIHDDTSYPFTAEDSLLIEIVGSKLVVKKDEPKSNNE